MNHLERQMNITSVTVQGLLDSQGKTAPAGMGGKQGSGT